MDPARPARHDGWTPQRQLDFLDALARTRSVARSARAAGMSREGAYRLRARDPHGLFAAAWDRALALPRSQQQIDEGHIRVIRLGCGPEADKLRIRRVALTNP